MRCVNSRFAEAEMAASARQACSSAYLSVRTLVFGGGGLGDGVAAALVVGRAGIEQGVGAIVRTGPGEAGHPRQYRGRCHPLGQRRGWVV
jgi:hypothetical protein